MENENQTLPTENQGSVGQPINNQTSPIQPIAEQPKVEVPATPVVEPIKIGQQNSLQPVSPPVAPAQAVAPVPVPIPSSEEVKNEIPSVTAEKAKTEVQWLNKAKPVESKVAQLKEDLAENKPVVGKFKTAIERLKAKRVEFKTKYPKGYKLTIGIIILAFLGAGYFLAFYEGDYEVSHELHCNPAKEKCFVWRCDPEEIGEDKCTGNPKEDVLYYKIEKRMASKIPYCDPVDPDCQPWVCEEGEKNCGVSLCEEDNEDEIECNDPETYVKENPVSNEKTCEGDECEEDEEIIDEEIENEEDSAEDLQLEEEALQEAEKAITSE